jgi:paired amphipathic helix protein Sin3a
VVLSRLKQKDEEWRRAQREWSRTWREVDSKNFYKSLDHQGISFKANDKKNITAKHFVADIELIKNEQAEAMEQEEKSSFANGSVPHQLEYEFHDTSVLLDSLKMVYSFLDRSQAQYSSQERRSVETFLRAFIPLLCMYPAAEFNAACGPLEGAHEEDLGTDLNGVPEDARSGRWSAGSTHSVYSGGVAPNDLRRKLLRAAQERRNGSHSPAASRDVSPSADHRSTNILRDEDVIDSPKDIWIVEAGADAYVESPFTDMARPFFANTTFYTLLRLLQVCDDDDGLLNEFDYPRIKLLYSRLLMCKQIGLQHAAQKHSTLLANRVAVELGLDEPNGPAAVLAQTMDVLGDRGATDDANVVYMYLLNACEKLFDSELDQATFEEHMRWFFGNKVGILFRNSSHGIFMKRY